MILCFQHIAFGCCPKYKVFPLTLGVFDAFKKHITIYSKLLLKLKLNTQLGLCSKRPVKKNSDRYCIRGTVGIISNEGVF